MLEQQFAIINKLGLHARASALFVKTASQFKSEIMVSRDGIEVNGKSIMGVMMLAAAQGAEIVLNISGVDESDAFQKLAELIQNGFGEE